MFDNYTAVAVQTVIRHVREPEWRDAIVRENVNRSLSLMDYVSHRWGSAKLYVLPEFSLTGVEEWTRTAIQIPGPDLEPLANFAKHNKAYVAGGPLTGRRPTLFFDQSGKSQWQF